MNNQLSNHGLLLCAQALKHALCQFSLVSPKKAAGLGALWEIINRRILKILARFPAAWRINPAAHLGEVGATDGGFPVVAWRDLNEEKCSLFASTIILDDNAGDPGCSAVLLGTERARELKCQMHLNRVQVAALIWRLMEWLITGRFEGQKNARGVITAPAAVAETEESNKLSLAAGNVSVITAQAKSRKTATIGAIIAALAAAYHGLEADAVDTLGFTAVSPEGRAVILLDTEQTAFDAWKAIRQAADRLPEVDPNGEPFPDSFRFYHLLDVATTERRAILADEMERAALDCGGIHLVIIDCVADLIYDVNDPKECNPFVDELHSLADRYSCPILTILHENPGYLGSQLERRSTEPGRHQSIRAN